MSGFITEIAVVVIIYLILKKYWNTKVKEYFGNFSNRFRYSDGYIDETFIIRLFNLFLIPKLSEIYSMTSLFTGIETVILLFIFLYFLIKLFILFIKK